MERPSLTQELYNALKYVEWHGYCGIDCCPFCLADKDSATHTEDCIVFLALTRFENEART